MKSFNLVCRFIDRDFKRNSANAGKVSIAIAGLPWLALLPFRDSIGGTVAAVLAASALTIAWSGLVVWRAWRLLRSASIQGDRLYDQTGKLILPPEYRDSESATKARQKRRS